MQQEGRSVEVIVLQAKVTCRFFHIHMGAKFRDLEVVFLNRREFQQ